MESTQSSCVEASWNPLVGLEQMTCYSRIWRYFTEQKVSSLYVHIGCCILYFWTKWMFSASIEYNWFSPLLKSSIVCSTFKDSKQQLTDLFIRQMNSGTNTGSWYFLHFTHICSIFQSSQKGGEEGEKADEDFWLKIPFYCVLGLLQNVC